MARDQDRGPQKKKGEVPVREAAELEHELTTRETEREDERERREKGGDEAPAQKDRTDKPS